MNGFPDFKLNKQLLTALELLGFSQPTPIQQKCIPLIMGGQDVIGIAQTGTGKTGAFMLPLLKKLSHHQLPENRVLVLAPGKELVLQLAQHSRDLASQTDIIVTALFGGVGPKQQISLLQEGCDILISTPGRFLDLYTRGELVTKNIKTLVLDEADRMMDMGFMPQLRKILEVIPVKRQNLLFSATMSPKVMQLSQEFLDFPQIIEITTSATPAQTVDQVCYSVPNLKTKIRLLDYLLQDKSCSKVMIFTRTRQSANDVYKFIERKNMGPAGVLHANKSQNSRIAAIQRFREGEIRILVSTDVSARGIDVEEISHVINIDVPVMHEEYVHRIGRTGRAGQAGKAITMVNEAETYHLTKIEKLMGRKIKMLALPGNIEVSPTPYDEKQKMAREIDHQKRLENPDFQGAFHEKKKRVKQKGKFNKKK